MRKPSQPCSIDTSPANVARVLRTAAAAIQNCGDRDCIHLDCIVFRHAYALADALDAPAVTTSELMAARTAFEDSLRDNGGIARDCIHIERAINAAFAVRNAQAATTWEERTKAAREAFYASYCSRAEDFDPLPSAVFGQDIPAALKAAFPEMAPEVTP